MPFCAPLSKHSLKQLGSNKSQNSIRKSNRFTTTFSTNFCSSNPNWAPNFYLQLTPSPMPPLGICGELSHAEQAITRFQLNGIAAPSWKSAMPRGMNFIAEIFGFLQSEGEMPRFLRGGPESNKNKIAHFGFCIFKKKKSRQCKRTQDGTFLQLRIAHSIFISISTR